ncbi:MAG: protein mobC [Myxococcales bacterium]
MPLTRAQVALLAEKARRMPPAPPAEANVTKQEAVRLLAGEIASLQRKGYTLEQIVASFRGDGLELSTATMKSYLSRVKASRRRRRGVAKQARLPPKEGAPLTRPETPPLTATGAARLTQKETPPLTNDTPGKSGRDAFLVKDKDSY